MKIIKVFQNKLQGIVRVRSHTWQATGYSTFVASSLSDARESKLILRSSLAPIKNIFKREGFTLIELLVVIAIIGVLASTVLASLNTARAKSRDARRRADLSQLRLALELYYDANGAYPLSAAGPNWYSSEPSQCCSVSNNSGNWIPGLAPTYIPLLPREPLPGTGRPQPVCGGWIPAYIYISNGTGYTLLSHCSPEGTWTSGDGFYDSGRPTWAFRVCVNFCT